MNDVSPVRVVLLIAGVWLSTTSDAAAYIDPGSSSYLFQILIAGLTALAFFFSSIKRHGIRLCRSIFGKKRADEPAPPTPADVSHIR